MTVGEEEDWGEGGGGGVRKASKIGAWLKKAKTWATLAAARWPLEVGRATEEVEDGFALECVRAKGLRVVVEEEEDLQQFLLLLWAAVEARWCIFE